MPRRKKTSDNFRDLLNNRCSAADLAASIVSEFGGVQKFARTIFTEFSKDGNAVARQRILMGVITLITQAERLEAPPDLMSMGDEELMEFASEIDAKQQAATAAPARSKPAADDGPQEETGSAGASP